VFVYKKKIIFDFVKSFVPWLGTFILYGTAFFKKKVVKHKKNYYYFFFQNGFYWNKAFDTN